MNSKTPMLKKKTSGEAKTYMREKVILLNKELSRRKDPRTLTLKQEIQVEIYNNAKRLHQLKKIESYYRDKFEEASKVCNVVRERIRRQQRELYDQ